MPEAQTVIDADGHILEPPTLWLDYVEKKFLEKAPRFTMTEKGDLWRFGDDYSFGSLEASFNPGNIGARDGEGEGSPRYVDGRKGGFDPHARIPDMDREGLDRAFLYPTTGLSLDMVKDPDQAAANYRGYNRWLADYCGAYPDRLFGVALLPFQTLDAAITEMRRCVREHRVKAVLVRPNPADGRVLHHEYFYPFWAEAQDLNIAIAVHGSVGRPNLGSDRFPVAESRAVNHCTSHVFEMMAAMTSFIMRICDAFPRLRVGFLEAGGGWALGLLDRMDRHFDDLGMNDTEIDDEAEREIFGRQCFISFEPIERSLKHVAETLGLENLLFATDYPHPDGFWGAAQMIKRMNLKPDVEDAVFRVGAEKFYGLHR